MKNIIIFLFFIFITACQTETLENTKHNSVEDVVQIYMRTIFASPEIKERDIDHLVQLIEPYPSKPDSKYSIDVKGEISLMASLFLASGEKIQCKIKNINP